MIMNKKDGKTRIRKSHSQKTKPSHTVKKKTVKRAYNKRQIYKKKHQKKVKENKNLKIRCFQKVIQNRPFKIKLLRDTLYCFEEFSWIQISNKIFFLHKILTIND